MDYIANSDKIIEGVIGRFRSLNLILDYIAISPNIHSEYKAKT